MRGQRGARGGGWGAGQEVTGTGGQGGGGPEGRDPEAVGRARGRWGGQGRDQVSWRERVQVEVETGWWGPGRGPRRSHASGAEGKAAGRRKRLWGPGATCLPARKPVGQPQRACSAPAAAPSGETPPRPPAARRPAPPRRPATPLVAAATLPPGEPPAAKLVFPDDVTLHPHPRAARIPGECGLGQSCDTSCSAASSACESDTSSFPIP